MRNLIYRTFLAHPESVRESYFEHFLFALKFSGLLLLASTAAMIHAILPAVCEKTASRIVTSLYESMLRR